jgi:hypothetical protein
MPVTLTLAMPEGRVRDLLADELKSAGASIELIDPVRPPERIASDALIHLPGEDPFVGLPRDLPDQVDRLSTIAAISGARFIFCSSTLLYADGGDDELMANDPELDPPLGLEPLADAELACFHSQAELLLLRLGLIVDVEAPIAARLRDAARSGVLARSPDQRVFMPLLDRLTLASALIALAPSNLHGAWDLVAAVATIDQAEAIVLESGAGADGVAVELSVADSETFLKSRNVTGGALRQTGAIGPVEATSLLARALS